MCLRRAWPEREVHREEWKRRWRTGKLDSTSAWVGRYWLADWLWPVDWPRGTIRIVRKYFRWAAGTDWLPTDRGSEYPVFDRPNILGLKYDVYCKWLAQGSATGTLLGGVVRCRHFLPCAR